MDPRQPRGIEPDDYSGAIDDDIDDLSIGVLEEGFDWDHSDEEVDESVRKAITTLEDLGTETGTVSIDLHRLTVPIWTAAAVQGGVNLLEGETVGTSFKGWY